MKFARVIVLGTLLFSSIVLIAISYLQGNSEILKSGSVLSAILFVATFISGTNDALSLVDRFKKRDTRSEREQIMEDKKLIEEQHDNIAVGKEDDKNITKIALWGPSNSGKTWLISAFNKALLDQDDHDFFYEIWEEDMPGVVHPLFAEPPQVMITTTSIDKKWRFIRRPKTRVDPSYSIQVSAFRHALNIQDSNGASNLTDPIFLRTIDTSDAIFLFLNLAPPQEALSEDIIMKYLYKLREISTRNRKKDRKRYIAICLSKCDLVELKKEPWDTLYVVFGERIFEMVQEIKKIPNIELDVFLVSSAGFAIQKGEVLSNLVPQTGEILYPDRWQPYNVESPFFWLFENIERQRLSRILNPLDSILGFAEERKKHYVPYSPITRNTERI